MQQNEELSHEDIKDFMNEPEPEAKAPEPMDLGDAPVPPTDFPGRLTTAQIASLAFTLGATAASMVGYTREFDPSEQYEGWVNHIVHSAANPNGHEVMREIHEELVLQRHRQGIYLLPYSKISPQEKYFYTTFRAVVVSSIFLWTGH